MKKSIQHGADALFLRQRLPLSGNGRCRFFRCGGNFRRSFTIFIYAVKTKADGNRIIDPLHKYVVKVSHFFTKSCLVYGSNLFEQNDGILDKPILFSVNVNMRWQLCFPELACDGGGNYGWTVLVSDVVLHNQYRTKTALFASDDRTEIRIVNIASFDSHADSRSAFDLLGCILSLLFPQKTKLNHGDDKKLLFIIGLPLCFTKASHSFRHNSLGDSTAYAARPFRPGFWGPFSLYCPPSVFDRHTASFSTNQT